MSTVMSAAAREPAVVPVDALGTLLEDLSAVLMQVDTYAYVAHPATGVSGSVGAHVRHLLDHVAAFVEAGGASELCYDHRQRGTSIERDPAEALSQIYRLQLGLERMAVRRQDEPVLVRSQLDRQGRSVTSWSTLGRELAFVMSHTIHHQAIIALLLADKEPASVPERFGYAPSTPLAS
jgi:uncharacterized damage-inducible protein DinB